VETVVRAALPNAVGAAEVAPLGAEVAAEEVQPDVAAARGVAQPGAVAEVAEPDEAGGPVAQDVPEGELLSEIA
jgi:hypothetical protein